jgi:hypothetical protein
MEQNLDLQKLCVVVFKKFVIKIVPIGIILLRT